MEYTRNRDLSYYKTNSRSTNCGSYALRLNEWYEPPFSKRYDDVYDYLSELYQEGLDDWEVANTFAETLIDTMLLEFEGELFDYVEDTTNMERIAFCTWCVCDDCDGTDLIDWDFHFRVLRDGKWMEKNGCCPVAECDESDWGRYNSDVFYLYHWVGEI